MTRQRGPEYREARADELLDVAEDVVRRIGAHWSVEDVARAVGVARPVLYRYFGSRDGLADALAARTTERLAAAVLDSLTQAGTPRAAVHAGIDAYLAFIEADPNLYRFAITHRSASQPPVAPRPPDRRRRTPAAAPPATPAEDIVGDLGRGISAALADALRVAGRDSGPAEAWAYGIVGMMAFAGQWWLDRRTLTREALAEHLTELATNGLGISD